MYDETTIAYNNATELDGNVGGNGGGISLQQSELQITGSCNISSNHAIRGGGIHATSSTITVHQSGILRIMDNSAIEGGGIHLAKNPRMYLLKLLINFHKTFLEFKGNCAIYGGAIFVADDINSGACLLNVECFIQTLAVYVTKNKKCSIKCKT